MWVWKPAMVAKRINPLPDRPMAITVALSAICRCLLYSAATLFSRSRRHAGIRHLDADRLRIGNHLGSLERASVADRIDPLAGSELLRGFAFPDAASRHYQCLAAMEYLFGDAELVSRYGAGGLDCIQPHQRGH